ncbi:metallophosphoesterase [Thermovibrio ammonificans]|uniref:Phosphoesterase n=1 Tax=Thermovibrio ammonificans (strain DSM 15698 / JCM 12110 / HB-1) TaxID=648996 RepID=E8T4V9_THEA1|nr:metallophosphoesterase [Thermovibrio ammonificans]ADU96371.1 phosphodiesterase, MJ0936 family [Thermovibrio ammonificans HB-1]
MKVAVVSDSHDNLKAVEQFIEEVNNSEVELVIHCGDFVSPFTVKLMLQKLKCDFTAVFGNNDGEVAGLLKVSGGLIEKPPVLKELNGLKVAVMHEPLFVEALAKSGEFDALLYGHTHQLRVEEINGCKVINPGELCGYLTGKKTFVILDTRDLSVEVRELK